MKNTAQRSGWFNVAKPNAYEVLATEYYDSASHPTCADFREASKKAFSFIAKKFPDTCERAIEVGAGKSLLAETLYEQNKNISGLTLTDASHGMLRHSQKYIEYGARLLVANAMSLPLRDATYDCVTASLGDPYNTDQFWREISRITKTEALVLFTTPSFEWANNFRSASINEAQDKAMFIDRSGTVTYLDSFIYSEIEQIEKIQSNGFSVEEIIRIRPTDITQIRSIKLTATKECNDPFLTAYVVLRN